MDGGVWVVVWERKSRERGRDASGLIDLDQPQARHDGQPSSQPLTKAG